MHTKKNLVSKTNTKKIITNIIGEVYSNNSKSSKILSKCCKKNYIRIDGGEWICPNCKKPR
jgi:hypothetical protein